MLSQTDSGQSEYEQWLSPAQRFKKFWDTVSPGRSFERIALEAVRDIPHLYSSSLQCGIICFTVTVAASSDMMSPLLPANFKGQKSLGTTFAACAGCPCDDMRLTSSSCTLLVNMIIPLVIGSLQFHFCSHSVDSRRSRRRSQVNL